MAATWKGMCAWKIHGQLQRLVYLRCNTQFSRYMSIGVVPFSTSDCFSSVLSTHRIHKLTRNARPVKLSCISPVLSPKVFYSTKSTKSEGFSTGSLTEELLKSKTARSNETKETGQNGPNVSEEAGADQKEGKSKSKAKSWFSGEHAWKLGLLSLTAMGAILAGEAILVWGVPARDKDGNEIIDEFSDLPKHQAYPRRAMKEFHFFKKMIMEPSSEKLLPDPLQEPYYQPPYTLVLEMTGVLVHPDWTLSTGWRFKKRPAVDYFLQQIGPPLFEVVIYTHEQGFTAFPIIDGLDPNGFISYRLFRDATRYKDGVHVKDLGCLNRDLSKVIIIDCDPAAFQMHPRNAVPLPKWTGNDDDKTLVDLANFLRTIAASNVEDVRTVLDHYNQYDNPLEAFKDNQRRLQEEQDKRIKGSTDKADQKSLASNWAMGLTGRRR